MQNARFNKSPAELRSMFGSNLRTLAEDYPSISELSRQLGINRTQFNRYLAGESFPRPDVLARICNFFDVDARVLLEPVEDLDTPLNVLNGPVLGKFLGAGMMPGEDFFPSGFYMFSRRSFVDEEKFLLGLVRVWRNPQGDCLVRGFEAREALKMQGLPALARLREFRGIALRMESGIGFLAARNQASSGSFNFLTKVVSFENNFWAGYVTRTVPENNEGNRVGRMVYEHLGTRLGPALAAGRMAGLVSRDAVPPFHLRLLHPDTDFR